MNDPSFNPYLAPQAPQPQAFAPDATPYGNDWRPEPATFGIRAGARIIDLIAATILGFICGAIGGAIVAIVWPESASQLKVPFHGPALLLSTLGSLAYHSLSESIGGSSIGKAVCGLRVVRQDDFGKASFGSTLIRNLAYYIDSFFFGMVAYAVMSKTPMQQRLGDKWGKTVVVKKASLRNEASLPGPIGGIAIATLVWGVFLTMSIVVKVL